MTTDMKRRDFIALGGAGLVSTAALTAGSGAAEAAVVCTTPLAPSTFNLAISSTTVEMIDGVVVPVLSYSTFGSPVRRVPGPVLRVVEGNPVSITISNGRPEAHGFEIGGIPGAKMTINPGQTCRLTFTAPMAGTYMYHDPNAPGAPSLYRLLGLHGAFIVHPRNGWSVVNASRRCITPYSMDRIMAASDPSGIPGAQKVSMVFEAFANDARFPGSKWSPCALGQEYSMQERIWLFSEIDPRLNALIRPDRIASSSLSTSETNLRNGFLPRYFTINGRSGYDLSEGDDVVIKNYIGEPVLIRTLNAGLCHHATHIHGNHLFELAHSILKADAFIPFMGSSKTGALTADLGKPILHDNIWERDVWPTWPMQTRDMLLPMEAPPDIPDWQKHISGDANERFPLRYVMHDHCEMGTTAAGGNYPQGAVTHWEIAGPLGGRSV